MNLAPVPICARQGRFLDSEGRQVILRGINLVNKDPDVGYLGSEPEATFAAFRNWGFNCLRLGVIWDGLEPQPGVYNQAYLDGIDRQIAMAHDQGLYVFLDMHQDLYSVLYSDGAPEWATLHEGEPHVGDSAVWSDAYFVSPAVQTSLDNFWRNAPAPDGMGLQDHFAACWRHLAGRYGRHPAVIGYDLFNEPVPGATSPLAMAQLFARGAEVLSQMGLGIEAGGSSNATGPSESAQVESMMAQWLTPEGRAQVLQVLSDPQVYGAVVDAAQPVYNQFEREALMPFYRKVTAAIREVDPDRLIFVETSMGSNMGIYSAVEPVLLGGTRDPQQAYAPHGYDLVVDTADVAQASSDRVGVIFRRHAETAVKHGWPMLVGEWGAFGSWSHTLPAARAVVRLFEQLQCSDTYWAYEPGIEGFDCFPALSRPYPERVAGALESYHYDPDTGCFTCAWQEAPAITAPTVIYVPDWFDFAVEDVRLDPASAIRIEHRIGGAQPGGTCLLISPTSSATYRTLTIR